MRAVLVLLAVSVIVLEAGCQPSFYRQRADRVADKLITTAQTDAIDRAEPVQLCPAERLRRRLIIGQDLPIAGAFDLGPQDLIPVPHWPEKDYPYCEPPDEVGVAETLELSLVDALEVAAKNNFDYQTQKENIFLTALDLDRQLDFFRNTFSGTIQSGIISDHSNPNQLTTGLENSADLGWQKNLETGGAISADFGVDLVKLLTLDRASSLGLLADATVTIPLLRGSGKYIVMEPLTQAQRNLVYSIWKFEQFKKSLAVNVADGYYRVLQQLDAIANNAENYRNSIRSARRAIRLNQAGTLSSIEVDQARQSELSARQRWIAAQQAYANQLDSFKVLLGLPADARVELDPKELEALSNRAKQAFPEAFASPSQNEADQQIPPADAPIELAPLESTGPGLLSISPADGVKVALDERLDLAIAEGRVEDAQRNVVVAADALKAGLTLTGTAVSGQGRSLGSAGADNAQLRLDRGVYAGRLALDLPLHRTIQSDDYRESFITLDQSVRDAQGLEDQIKLDVQSGLRDLALARESIKIQAAAVALADRRVKSTMMFLEASRAEIRDVLDAQESLLAAQNLLTAALVGYRISELSLQRDMGVLQIDQKGNWHEYEPQ